MSFVVILSLILIVVAAWYFCAPLLSSDVRAEAGLDQRGTDMENLNLQKEEVISTLKDLELDHQLKRLSDSEYQALYRESFEEGSSLLKQMDAAEKGEVVAAKEAPVVPVILKRFCSQCGGALEKGARFCSQCGAKI